MIEILINWVMVIRSHNLFLPHWTKTSDGTLRITRTGLASTYLSNWKASDHNKHS